MNNWQRFEYKYVLPRYIVEAMIPDLLCFSNFDLHSNSNTGYEVRSIYFDTPDWQFYDEKIAGIYRRKKFRVRSYEKFPKEDDTVFLEVKEKVKDVILKRRVTLPLREVRKIVSGGSIAEKDPVIDEWRFHLLRYRLHPQVLLSYDRLAFVSKDKSDFRITVDSLLRCRILNGNFDFTKPMRAVDVMKDNCVLEIKFNNYIPRKVSELIKKYNLRNDAFSKYCESIIYNYKLI